jgi:HK97 gp10 family phage protein
MTERSLHIQGLDEVNKILVNMPAEIQRRLTFQALRKSAKPMKDEAVNLAPRRTGTIKMAMTIVNNQYEDLPGIMISVTKGSKYKGEGTANRNAWYARFQEYGTSGFGRRKKWETWDRSIARTAKLGGAHVYQRNTGRRAGIYSIVSGYKNKGAGLPAREFMLGAFNAKAAEVQKNVVVVLREIVVKYWTKYAPKYAI